MLSLIASVFIVVIALLAWRQSSGLFSLPSFIMLYIVFLYLGTLHFYRTQGHLTFLFVLLMAFFYFLGMLVASAVMKSKSRVKDISLTFYSPFNVPLLKLSLTISCIISVCISMYRVLKFGAPLFSGEQYTVGIIMVTGGLNRLLYALGPCGLLVIALLAYALYKAEGEGSLKYLALMSFVLHIAFEILQGGKAAGIMPFLLMLMVMFYVNRKIPKKTVTVIAGVALIASLLISYFWTGSLSFSQYFQLYFYRTTVDAALHLDYLLYEWAPTSQYLFGGTVWLEIKRIAAQLGFAAKEPLFKEIIANLRVGLPVETVTGISPELSVFGNLGYANFGILGAVLVAIVLGCFVRLVDISLYSRRAMNCFSFVLWMYFIYHLLGFVRAGDLIIGLEKYIVEVTPVLLMICSIYTYMALPYPKAMRWRKLVKPVGGGNGEG